MRIMLKNRKNIILIVFTVMLLSLNSCKNNTDNITNTISSQNSKVKSTPTPTETLSESINTKEQEESENKITEESQYPELDKDITKSLTNYMYESFGGSGNEKYATSWYQYIDYWEVYQNEDLSYSGKLYLKECPYDYYASIFLKLYYSDDELDKLCTILRDAGASLELDSVELGMIGEDLYKISISEDSEICYYSLAAYGIPVYDFLSKGSGWSVSDIKDAIKHNQIPGDDAYECLVDYMSEEYKGAFTGLSMENVKHIAAALIGYSENEIEVFTIYDQNSNPIYTNKTTE